MPALPVSIPDNNVEPEFNQVFRTNSQNGKCREKRNKLNKTMRKLSDKSKSGAFEEIIDLILQRISGWFMHKRNIKKPINYYNTLCLHDSAIFKK